MRLYTLLKNTITSVAPISKGGTGASSKSEIVNNFKNSLINTLYPIGSIYISIDENFSPSERFGGEWTRLEDKFLLGAGTIYTAGESGGHATHALTTSEMPGHTHTFTGSTVTPSSSGTHSHTVYGYYGAGGGSYSGIQWWKTYKNTRTTSGLVYSAGAHTHTVTSAGSNENVGSDQPHNNMPPYIIANIWERTA